MSERIANLKLLIEREERCRATHKASSVIRENFRDEQTPIWEGVVETFDLEEHLKGIKRAYAWQSWRDQEKRQPEYKFVLGVPPINSPEDAIRAAIAAVYRQL